MRIVPKLLLAAVGAAGLIAASGTPETVKGATYRIRNGTQMAGMGGGGGGGDEGGRGFPGGFGGGPSQLVRVDLAGKRAKVEFQLGAPPGSSVLDYYLMVLDSNKVYRVSPDSQTYADASLGGVGGFGGRGGGRGPGGGGGGDRAAAAGAGRGGRGNAGGGGGDGGGRGGRGGGGGMNPMTVLQDLVITGMKTTTEDLGAGEAIETRPTRHYKITADYDFKLYGQARTAKTVSEVWAVDFPMKIVDPFEGASTTNDSLSYTGISARLVAEQKKIPGVLVKVVTTQTIPVAIMGGAEAEVTPTGQVPQTVNIVRTTLVTALKEVDVDETLLTIPAGYRKTAGFGRPGGQ